MRPAPGLATELANVIRRQTAGAAVTAVPAAVTQATDAGATTHVFTATAAVATLLALALLPALALTLALTLALALTLTLAFLAGLAVLTWFAVLALLAFSTVGTVGTLGTIGTLGTLGTLLTLLTLARALGHSLAHGVHATRELARLVERLGALVAALLPHRVGGIIQLLAQRIDIGADFFLEVTRVLLRRARAEQALRVADFFLHLVVANAADGL